MALGQQDGDKGLRVLIVGADRALEEEFRSALAGVPDRHGVIHFADSYREAVEVARRRQPNFILIDVDREVDAVAGLSKDLQELLPGTPIVGAVERDRLERGQTVSATIIELLRAEMRDFIQRPLSTTELRAVLDRLFSRLPEAPSAVQGRVASFMSNKGGVGKSTLAVNVACGLALRHPDEVLLIDTSLQLGTCAFMLDLRATTSIVDAVRERDRLDRTLLRHLTLRHPSGLRLLAAPADALEGAEVDDEAVVRIVNMARRSFKYVIVDTFPMLDSILMTYLNERRAMFKYVIVDTFPMLDSILMTILDSTDVAFVVTQGTAPAVAGIARLLPTLEGLGLSEARQRLVLNYNYQPFLGDLRPADIGERLQRTMDYVVPYEKRVMVSVNTGSPEILHARRWQRFGRTINRMIDEVSGLVIDGSRDVGAATGIDRRLTHVARQQGTGRTV